MIQNRNIRRLISRAALTLTLMLLTLFTSATARAQLNSLTYNSAGFYEIWTADDLQAMADYYNGYTDGGRKVFKMMQDIDLKGVNISHLPIASQNSTNYFGDEFDGNGHTIKNLRIVSGSGITYYGLFQQLSSTATVQNLTLLDCDVRYTGTTNYTPVGAIAGRNLGTIRNCTVIGTVANHDNEYCVGAIVGCNFGKAENCTAIAGQPIVGTPYNSSESGTVTGSNIYYRLLTTSDVSLTTTPAPMTVAGTACYAAGTALVLTVTPNNDTQMLTDVTFTGTTTTKTAYGQYTLTIPAGDVNVTASLAEKITIASASGGTVTPSTYSPAVGSQVSLTIAPNTGYALTTITATAGGSALTLNGSGLTRTFTMPDKPVSITATFSAINYTISGLGSKTGGSINASQNTAHYGDQVTLTATPDTGYSLQTLTVTTAGNQNVALSGSGNTRTFTMPAENVTVNATFAMPQLAVHITAYNCTATATPNPATMGQTVTLNITPDAGATLQNVEGWYVNNSGKYYLTITGSGNTRTLTMPETDVYVTIVCSTSGQLAGNGTQDEPYLLYDESDLRLLSSQSKTNPFNRIYFRLERDITMSNTAMQPIGNSSAGYFKGYFDGNGHIISNLHISEKLFEYTALFGVNYGSVSNLTLASCTITGNESGTYHVAAIAGSNYGTVSNCHVSGGTISATAAFEVGGIVGENNGTVSGCSNGAAVSITDCTVESKVGGIVGNNISGTVKNCTNTGNVSVSGTGSGHTPYNCGGIVGQFNSGIVSGCANTGSVSATGSDAYDYAGGVAGSIDDSNDAICIGNTNGGAVTAANGSMNNAGGIVGFYDESSYILKNNYYFGACTAKGTAGWVNSGDAPQSDVTANNGAVRGYAIIKPAEVTLSSIEGYADVEHPAYAAEGETVSFTVTLPEDGVVETVICYDGSDHTLIADANGKYSFTMPAKDVTISFLDLALLGSDIDPQVDGSAAHPYIISTTAGWDHFCDLLADNETFSGKTLKLGASITVTRMAGDEDHRFKGTFDGNGNTLTLDYGSAESPIDAQYVAPFVCSDGNTTFRNLTIDGSIYEAYTGSADHHHVGGLIGLLHGTVTIEHCTSNVSINTTGGAGGFVGLCENAVSFTDCVSHATIRSTGGSNSGFVGWSRSSEYTISFAGCLFNGKLLKVNGNGKDNGGFIGWKGDKKTVTITNSFCAPAALAGGETMADGNGATFSREHADHAATITNSFYTEAFGTAQGTTRRTVTAAGGITIGSIALSGSTTTYGTSGITAYANGGLSYGGDLYYGSGDQVSLTLSGRPSGTAPAGYQFASTGYTTNAGTLTGSSNPYTLTMADADATISALAPIDWATESTGDDWDNAYMIYNKDQLDLLAHRVNSGTDYSGKYFKQMVDIELSGEWTPIGIKDYPFKGNYDGGGHIISGLQVTGSCEYAGLFGYTDNSYNEQHTPFSIYLKDIRIVDCKINVTGSNAGGIAGRANVVNISGCRVSGTITSKYCACGLFGSLNGSGSSVTDCFVDVTVSATDEHAFNRHECLMANVSAGIPTVSGNYYHDNGGGGAPGISATPLYTVTAPSGLTAAGTNAMVTYNGTHYYAANATETLTVSDANKIITTFSVSGTTTYSVAADKKSATVTLASSDATVTATLLTLTGTCGDGVTWAVTDTDNNGTYETLTLSGSGTVNASPWAADFAATIERVNIGSADITISGNPFGTLGNDAVIVAPTPAYAVGYISAAFATKLRVALGSQLFSVTNEGGTPAYAITSEDDLRNLAAVINSNTNASTAITGSGMTFRQTADIAFSDQIFTPIGAQGTYGKKFNGTYDGGNHTISGLKVSTDDQYAGLFGRVETATIKNVVLVSPTVTSNYSNGSNYAYVGALVACTVNISSVENCLVISPSVSAASSNSHVGAIVGELFHPSDKLTNSLFYSTTDYAYAGKYDARNISNSGRGRKVIIGEGVTIESPVGLVYHAETYYCEGATLTLSKNAPTGYLPVFSANGIAFSGNTYTVTSTDGVTLAAIGTAPITYTVHFKGNGSTGGEMADQPFTYDAAQNLTANGFSRTFTVTYSYNGATGGNDATTATATSTFNGWATSAGGTVDYTNQQSVSNLTAINNDIVNLYAKWTDNSVTLPTPTKTHYTFAGWYSNAGLTNKVGDAGESYTPSADITLYAKWTFTPIDYIDADGNKQTRSNATVLTSGTDVSHLSAGWYVVYGNVSYSLLFYCSSGDIHLILCDGAKMTVTNSDKAIYLSNGSLTIYAQSTGSSMGRLEATSSDGSGIYVCDNVTICGGRITATGKNSNGFSGIFANQNITIHGGQVSATGDNGIRSDNGNITLGLRNATDYITASSYNVSRYRTISVKTGQTLTDGTNAYSGNLTSSQISAIAGKTLRHGLFLADNADNSSALVDFDGKATNVILKDRTLWKDGNWNTLCLPFDVTIAGSVLDGHGVDVRTLSSASLEGSTLTLNFTDKGAVKKMEAGKPYIIKWDAPVTNFTYRNIQGTDGYGDEDCDNLFDGDTKTKWCSSSAQGWFCEFETSVPLTVTDYTLTTGSDTYDNPERNPQIWTLKAKLKNGDDWTTIDSRNAGANSSDALPGKNETAKSYSIADEKQTLYQYFRFEVTEVRGGNILQLSELSLTGTEDRILEPTFTNVTIDNTNRNFTSGPVTFMGTFEPFIIGEGGDNSILYLGNDNTLYYPNRSMTIKACRAYFQLNGGLTAGDPTAPNGIRAFNLNFGDGDETQGIYLTPSPSPKGEGSFKGEGGIYTLDGVKLDKMPTRKGVYIKNGRKVVIK